MSAQKRSEAVGYEIREDGTVLIHVPDSEVARKIIGNSVEAEIAVPFETLRCIVQDVLVSEYARVLNMTHEAVLAQVQDALNSFRS